MTSAVFPACRWLTLLAGTLLIVACNQPITVAEDGAVDAAGEDASAGCNDDSACGGATPRCDRNSGRCVACLPLNDNCPMGTRCVPSGSEFICSGSCLTSADCPKTDAGVPGACCGGTCTDSSRDPLNCGNCGKVCSAANASPVCTGGQCTIGTCDSGFGDCDGLLTNGCETSIADDLKNCGACGHQCTAANATPTCQSQSCAIASCTAGFADCNGSVGDGCEVNTSTDPNHCGGCNKPCPAPPNASATCANAVCGVGSCKFGFADCDMNAANGCETNVAGDVANCGNCSNQCPAVANGTAGCTGGMCGVASCAPLFGDCDMKPANGCEQSLATDIANCGKCGNACSFANATAACINGQCGITACNAGFADCDGNATNGCEVNLKADKSNCGKCGNVCPMNLPNCGNGTCTLQPVLIGQFMVDSGPYFGANPPCYSCQEACALLFGGVAGSYSCSTQMGTVDHMAWADGYADTSHCGSNGGTPVAESYRLGTNYDCSNPGCSFSAYVSDHTCSSTNYCFQ